MKLTVLERPTPLTAKNFQTTLEREFEKLKGELNASITLKGFSRDGWAQIDIQGEDSEIVTELVANKFSIAHTELREIDLGNYQAEIIGSNERGLKFDLGSGSRNLDCMIPTSNLYAQLTDGRTIPVQQLIECYCLYPGMRISVRVPRKTNRATNSWLSDDFVAVLADWVTTGLDRILVFECFKTDADSAILRTHLTRDIIAVDSRTLTLQSIVCKLGTDAIGLIPRLGRILRRRTMRPFQPRKVLEQCRPW
jgi:hypothetical protein